MGILYPLERVCLRNAVPPFILTLETSFSQWSLSLMQYFLDSHLLVLWCFQFHLFPAVDYVLLAFFSFSFLLHAYLQVICEFCESCEHIWLRWWLWPDLIRWHQQIVKDVCVYESKQPAHAKILFDKKSFVRIQRPCFEPFCEGQRSFKSIFRNWSYRMKRQKGCLAFRHQNRLWSN